jgi:hypothetical protein
MSIQIQFSAQSDLGSEVIKVFERGEFSHVDAIDLNGNLWGARSDELGGKPAGVQIRPKGYAEFSKTAVYDIPCTATQEMQFWSFLRGQIGKPYDETAIVAFGLFQDWHNAKGWFCSELIIAALVAAGVFACPLSETPNILTPRDAQLLVSTVGVLLPQVQAATAPSPAKQPS